MYWFTPKWLIQHFLLCNYQKDGEREHMMIGQSRFLKFEVGHFDRKHFFTRRSDATCTVVQMVFLGIFVPHFSVCRSADYAGQIQSVDIYFSLAINIPRSVASFAWDYLRNYKSPVYVTSPSSLFSTFQLYTFSQPFYRSRHIDRLTHANNA